MINDLNKLEKNIDIKFKNRNILEKCLTHKRRRGYNPPFFMLSFKKTISQIGAHYLGEFAGYFKGK